MFSVMDYASQTCFNPPQVDFYSLLELTDTNKSLEDWKNNFNIYCPCSIFFKMASGNVMCMQVALIGLKHTKSLV